jgi:hypothetical protein
MKPLALMLIALPVWCQAPLKVASVSSMSRPVGNRQAYSDIEKRVDEKISNVGGNDHVYLLGLTRGLYLQSYGAVFTTELDLIQSPTPNPFHLQITKEEAVKVHQRKVQNLPLLRKSLHELWADVASSLTMVPDNEQVVLAVRLLYQPWEDTSGLPGQILLKGTRKAGVSAVQTEEE